MKWKYVIIAVRNIRKVISAGIVSMKSQNCHPIGCMRSIEKNYYQYERKVRNERT